MHQFRRVLSALFCPMHYYWRMPPGLADAAAGERVVARWGEVGKSDGVPHVRVPRHEIQVKKRQREGRGGEGRERPVVWPCLLTWVAVLLHTSRSSEPVFLRSFGLCFSNIPLLCTCPKPYGTM